MFLCLSHPPLFPLSFTLFLSSHLLPLSPSLCLPRDSNIWISRVSHVPFSEWVMSHIWTSHMWMSYVTYMNESHVNELCHIYERVTCECIWTSHMWMSYVSYMNESQLCMRPITIMIAWCHTYEWVMYHMWMSRIPYVRESCHNYECVVVHIWMACMHTTTLQHAATHCNTLQHAAKHSQKHIIVINSRHRTVLHWLYPPIILLSANLCVYHIAYIYTPTHSRGDPPLLPKTREESISLYSDKHTDQTKRLK